MRKCTDSSPRRFIAGLCMAAPLYAAVPSLRAQGLDTDPGLHFEYRKPVTDSLKPWYEFFLARKPFERNAEKINEAYKFERAVPVRFEECGYSNAKYDPSEKAIQICYEYALQFANLYNSANNKSQTQAVLNSLEFTFYHEVGHALVDLFDLPVVGNTEEAADQFAAYALLSVGVDSSPYTVIQSAYTKNRMRREITASDLADEHPLNQQRYYNLLCWVLGSNPLRFRNEILKAGLPLERARRCPSYFAKLNNSWDQLLNSHQMPAEIPELAANVVSITLFDPRDSSRTSLTEFERLQRSGIGFEVELSFRTPKAPLTVVLTCTFRDSEGEIVSSIPRTVSIRPGWTGAVVRGIVTSKRFQELATGNYYVECKSPIGGPVQSEEFSIR